MHSHPDLPIALFDSGVGGLTVFKAISERLPAESLLYLGDTARVPYGTKSPDTIIRYTQNAASALADRGIKMLVVACNTATAMALPTLRDHFAPLPVLGVVEPGAHAAVAASHSGHIAVIATEATIRGQAYQQAIDRLRPGARVTSRACTLLVPLAEEGWVEGSIPRSVASRYLADVFPQDEAEAPDTLLLGCTHFPLFRAILQDIVGPAVTIVDSASATAASVHSALAKAQLLRNPDSEARHHFMTTDNTDRFIRTGERFLGCTLTSRDVELVDL